MRFAVGDSVQTPFGKGVVREVRNGGRLLVDIGGRRLVVSAADVSPIEESRRRKRTPAPAASQGGKSREGARAALEVDLHGLTVEEALARSERALNDALLDDLAQLRFIHGRSGGRIRAALHRMLGGMSAVRQFRLDPRNEGVTIVEL